jgi:hypothetical protein
MMHLKKTFVVLAVILASSFQLIAQPGNPEEDPDNAVPITGIEWLLAGGAALGLKKLLGNRKPATKE